MAVMTFMLAVGCWLSLAAMLIGYGGMLWQAYQVSWLWAAGSVLFPPAVLAFWASHGGAVKPWGMACVGGLVGYVLFTIALKAVEAPKSPTNALVSFETVGVVVEIMRNDELVKPGEEIPGERYGLKVTAQSEAYSRVFGFNSGGGFTPISDIVHTPAAQSSLVKRSGEPFTYQFHADRGVVPGGPLYVVSMRTREQIEAFSLAPDRARVLADGVRIRTAVLD